MAVRPINMDPERSALESPGFAKHGVMRPLPYRCRLCRDDSWYWSERLGHLCVSHWLEAHGQPDRSRDEANAGSADQRP